MKIAITLEAAFGLNWERWQRLIPVIEQLGFAGLYRSDHLAMPNPPDMDALDAIVSLTYLASHSESIPFGTLIAPLSYRHPVMLARQATAINDLSGGRMTLGLGAGWNEREHAMFGYELGDVTTRLDRLEEGLEVITKLVRSDEPVSFSGDFFELHEAHLLPRPQHRLPILVGGNGPKRTIPMVARYADIWNCQVAPPETFRDRSALLDDLLIEQGRRPEDVKRTVMVPVLCWRTDQEFEEMAQALRDAYPSWAQTSTEQLLGYLRQYFAALAGHPDEVREELRKYAAAGADEFIVQWYPLDSIQGVEILAEELLPEITAS